MGIVIHEKQITIWKSFITFISDNYILYRGVFSFFNKKYKQKHVFRIIEESFSYDVKTILSLPYYGYIYYNEIMLYYKLHTTDVPLCPGQSDFADYYKELHIDTVDSKDDIDWNAFIKFIYEGYAKENRKKFKNQIPLYIWEHGWEINGTLNYKKNENIFLPDGIVENVSTCIDTFFKNSTRYEKLGVPHCNIFMFHGLPGTGKSSLIHAMATHFNYGLAIFDFDQKICDKNMKEAFEKVPENTFLVIEDIDCIFDSRKQNDQFKNNITFSGLLNVLDGIRNVENLIVFITTNHIEKLDQALKRRIHYFIKFDFATYKQKKEMILAYFPNSSEEDIQKICKTKTTMNILQKFIIRSLDYDTIQNINEFETFNNEYFSNNDLQDKMYL